MIKPTAWLITGGRTFANRVTDKIREAEESVKTRADGSYLESLIRASEVETLLENERERIAVLLSSVSEEWGNKAAELVRNSANPPSNSPNSCEP